MGLVSFKYFDFTSDCSPRIKNQLHSCYWDVKSSTYPLHEQTMKHLISKSCFRKIHSTDTSLSCLTDKILTAFDSFLPTEMILFYLQKGFDPTNHNILLREIASRGFPNHSMIWFQSYL